MKKVLIASYEVPGWSGASTSAYNLFRRMQAQGLDVCYVNIIDNLDQEFFRWVYGSCFGNPRLLDNVHNCILDEWLFSPHPGLDELIRTLSPDIMIGIDYIAALLLKTSAPTRPLVFLVASLNQVTSYLARQVRPSAFTLEKYLDRARRAHGICHLKEAEAIYVADLIVTNSELIRNLIVQVFPSANGRVLPDVIWGADWIIQDAQDHASLTRPFSERDIDVVFAANSWLRPEKNYQWIYKITRGLGDLSVHIIGEVDKELDGAIYHGFLADRSDLFAVLGRSKVLVCPSLFDTAPGILWEASVLGCNVVASRNCGNWRLCNEQLLVDPYEVNTFIVAIRRAAGRKLEDNMRYFLDSHSYQNLVDTLEVL